MVAPKPSGVCPITSSAPGGVVASLKGALCTRRCVQILAGATAIGVLGYVVYTYATASNCATAGCEVKSNSGQTKPTKKGGKTKRKKRRSASSARLGKSSGTSSTSTPGKPDELAESPAAPATPKAEDVAPPVVIPDAAVATPATSTSTAPTDQTEPTQ